METPTLNDVYNIIMLRLAVKADERSIFISHFTNTPTIPYDLFINGEVIGIIQKVDGQFKINEYQTSPEIEQLQKDLDKFFDNLIRLNNLKIQYDLQKKKEEEDAEQERLKGNLFSGINDHKPFRTIDLGDIFPQIDKNSFN